MDERERAAREHELRNEDVIREILVSGSDSELEEIRSLHGLTEEQIDFARHFARMRAETHGRMRDEERAGRTDWTPTVDEEEIGYFLSEIEPQVRHAVLILRKKGYNTLSSGFIGVGTEQHIKTVGDEGLDRVELPVSLRQHVHDLGFRLEAFPDELRLVCERKVTLDDIREAWDLIADALPDRGTKAPSAGEPTYNVRMHTRPRG